MNIARLIKKHGIDLKGYTLEKAGGFPQLVNDNTNIIYGYYRESPMYIPHMYIDNVIIATVESISTQQDLENYCNEHRPTDKTTR